MGFVIQLPIMGEKLLLTIIPDIYVHACIDAVRFDCTRQSSSAAISNLTKIYQNYTETKI